MAREPHRAAAAAAVHVVHLAGGGRTRGHRLVRQQHAALRARAGAVAAGGRHRPFVAHGLHQAGARGARLAAPRRGGRHRRHEFRLHGARTAHGTHAPGADPGCIPGLSVLRRDSHQPSGRVGAPPGGARCPRGSVPSHCAQRACGRHARTRLRAIHHRRYAGERAGRRGREHHHRAARVHPGALPGRDVAADVRQPLRAQDAAQADGSAPALHVHLSVQEPAGEGRGPLSHGGRDGVQSHAGHRPAA